MKLRNRIKMLEYEEKRAHKKLLKTRGKAQEILELKKRNYLKSKAREEVIISYFLIISFREEEKNSKKSQNKECVINILKMN